MSDGENAITEAAKRDFANYLFTLKFSQSTTDFTIVCGETKFQVHRAVLQVHSNVFKVWCIGLFKEAKDRTVDLSEYEEECVAALVHFLYHSNYLYHEPYEDTKSDRAHPCQLLFHTKMLILAEKYGIKPLQRLALEKFKTQAVNKAALIATDFTEAALCAYEAFNATESLRQYMVEMVATCRVYSLEAPEGQEESEFETAMKACPELAASVSLTTMRAQALLTIENTCRLVTYRDCGKRFVVNSTRFNGGNAWCPYCNYGAFHIDED